MQRAGKTRWTHDSIASDFVWVPKSRRKILSSESEQATKERIAARSERHDLTLVALEADQDHVPVFVSAPPRFSPAEIANLLKGYSSRSLPEGFLPFQAGVQERSPLNAELLCGHSGRCVRRNHRAVVYGVPGELSSAALGRSHPYPLKAMGLLAPA